MSKMLVKNTLRDISRTKARFVSIMLIIMLSVGFLVGINSVAPSMYAVVDEYYAEKNLMDFRLISTVGFSDEDVAAVSRIDGVEAVMPSYFTDVLPVGESGDVVRIYALPESYADNAIINEISLREGRLPEKDNEIVIGASRFGDYGIGSEISFTSAEGGSDISETLKNTKYEIVGIVDSPMYISFERGSTNVGSGKVAAYMMIKADNFVIGRYTDIYVTVSSLDGVKPYSEQYDEIRDRFTKVLEKTGELRVQAFSENTIFSAQASIDEAKLKFQSEKEKAENEIESAQQKIDEGYRELSEKEAQGRRELSAAKQKIEDGKKELESQKAEFKKTTSAAWKELADKESELTKGEAQIKSAKAELKESLFQSVALFGITEEQYEGFYGGKDMLSTEDVEKIVLFMQMYRTSIVTQLQHLQTALKNLEAELKSAGVDPETNAEYTARAQKIASLNKALQAIDTFLTSGKAELISAIEEINRQEERISAGKEEIEKVKTQLALGEEQAMAEFAAAEEKIRKAEEEYVSAFAQFESGIEDAKAKLAAGQNELNNKKSEAEAEFAKAEKEIADAQDKLNKVAQPHWLYHTRSNNPGYDAYVDDTERVNAVGKVFPVFFMLVAILVCVTTMSRLIEEQRGDIGALTTLGYLRKDIVFKYVVYSLSATVIGSVLGLIWGLPTIPFVIYNAYGMLYSSLPSLNLTVSTGSAVIAIVGAMVCTSSVALITCYSLLRKKPATLLRPKAPKPGKRILLEKIKFVWKRLGFFSKVTVRNIFRYKARFFMTVIGVAGCTALIFAAMGLYSSINDVVDKQFGEIFNYDLVVALEDGADSQAVKNGLVQDGRLEDVALCRQNMATVKTVWGTYTDDTYICVPENIDDFISIVDLHERKTAEPVKIGSEGVIISEKLANKLRVSAGDTVTVIDNDVTAELVVEGVCENYLYGYVFMSREVYEANFNAVLEYNMLMCTENTDLGNDHSEMGEDILGIKGVLGVSFISDSIKAFDEMIGSLDYVVLVMLVCAGALAFVVLYNLTNINIAERKREISTLKVLGFKDTETSAYIYRENLVLTLVGAFSGLALGIWFLKFIIKTIEMDMIMFGRELHLGSFILAFALTIVFAVIVNLVMHLRIKKIDMIESLKSVE